MAERAAFVQYLDPDRVDDYVAAHEEVPEAVTETMEAADVHWFDLYVRDDVAVCVMEVEDADRYTEVYGEAMAENEAIEEWERLTAEFKREGIDVEGESDGQIPWMERVWTFEPGP